jgi:protein-tyrosine phosphatase
VTDEIVRLDATTGFVDFHSHLLAGVDDGARDEEESRAAVGTFRAAGATALVTTPHFDGSLTGQPERMRERMSALDEAWEALRAWVEQEVPELRIGRGVELKLDVPEPDCSDPRVRLDGGRFVLVEFPGMQVPVRSELPLQAIARQGFTPVLAHPERYGGFDEELKRAHRWKNAGALLQINAGSLTGRYGQRARGNAELLLGAGLADFLCSDFHARGELATQQVLETADRDAEIFALLTRVNPQRLLDGELPIAVPAVSQGPWWKRVARAIRISSA